MIVKESSLGTWLQLQVEKPMQVDLSMKGDLLGRVKETLF